MSWFDSSFSFARTALSQAQKSIDKVLDIREEKESSQVEPEAGGWCELGLLCSRSAYSLVLFSTAC